MPLLLLGIKMYVTTSHCLINALPSGNQCMLSQQQQCNASSAAAVAAL